MQKTRKLFFAIFAIILLAGSIIVVKPFLFEKVKTVSSIAAVDLTVTDETVFFHPLFMTSADVMSHYSYRIENDIMYIKIKSVLVGVIPLRNVEIKGDFTSLQTIMLEDDSDQKMIWKR